MWIKSIRKLSINFNRIRRFAVAALAGLYFGIVVYFSISETYKYLWIIPIMAIGGSFIFIKWMDYISLYKICDLENRTNSKYKIFFHCFLIILVMQLIYWFAYYPGGFNLDAYGQWDQVHGLMKWNNWHPILTTLIYWLLTRIVDSFAFCILVQIVIFTISVSAVLAELYSHGVAKKWILICALYIAINPAIGMNNVCMIKDVPFTIGVVWLFWGMLKVFYSNGEWLQTLRGEVFFFCEIVILSLIRHNAILLVLPFIMMLLYNYRRTAKKMILTSALSFVLLCIIETVVYPAANIEQHSNVVGEMVGVPMAAMANALVNDYENTPESVKDFLENIADDDAWNNYYIVGEWDSCKWEFGGIDLLKDDSLPKILGLFVETAKECPEAVYDSFRENTRVVWQIIGHNEWNTWIYIEPNDYGIEENHNLYCEKAAGWLEKMSNTIVGSAFSWNIGFAIAVFVLLMLYMDAIGNQKLNSIILAIIAYDILTMLLLAGPSHRYFYFNNVLMIPVLLAAFSEKTLDYSSDSSLMSENFV